MELVGVFVYFLCLLLPLVVNINTSIICIEGIQRQVQEKKEIGSG